MLAPTPTFAPRILVRIAAAPASKEAAIREAAQLLTAAGCIDRAYGESMLRREGVANTYLGHGVVIPHGMVEDARALLTELGIPQEKVHQELFYVDDVPPEPVRGLRTSSSSRSSACSRSAGWPRS